MYRKIGYKEYYKNSAPFLLIINNKTLFNNTNKFSNIFYGKLDN
ncbi:hypothetical protein QEW_2207 [Clostridioides difficile CD160]|nr:hypothetical protein QEW_2207 [Clostridioides difficile CD160]